jgi:flagellar protein FlgJ
MPIKPLVSSAVLPAPAAAGERGGKKINEKKLRQAGEDFEALFLNQLLQSMRRTVIKSKLLGEAPGKEVYQSLFDRELSQKMAHQGGLGLGKVLVQKVLEKEKIQAVQPPGASRNPAPGAGVEKGGQP